MFTITLDKSQVDFLATHVASIASSNMSNAQRLCRKLWWDSVDSTLLLAAEKELRTLRGCKAQCIADALLGLAHAVEPKEVIGWAFATMSKAEA